MSEYQYYEFQVIDRLKELAGTTHSSPQLAPGHQ